jgi:hypothetical protein
VIARKNKQLGLNTNDGKNYGLVMVRAEQVAGSEWAAWYRLTPAQRWLESEKLWEAFLMLEGSLDPQPDTQSPFFDPRTSRPRPAYGRSGLRLVRRGGV